MLFIWAKKKSVIPVQPMKKQQHDKKRDSNTKEWNFFKLG